MDNKQIEAGMRKQVDKVLALKKQGMKVPEALNQVGIKKHVYGYWRGKLYGREREPRKSNKKVEMVTLPMQTTSGRTFLIVGSTRDITEILNGVQ